LFVTKSNDEATLIGTLTIRELLEAQDGDKLGDIMNPYTATLNPYDDVLEASYKILGSQAAAMAVTEADGRLIGAVTIDAAITHIVPGAGLHSLKIFS
jgi:Mg/Co/Ni transporter MgtE